MLKYHLLLLFLLVLASGKCQNYSFKSNTINVSACEDIKAFTTSVLDSSYFFKHNSSEIVDAIYRFGPSKECAYYPLVLSILGFENFISDNILKSRRLLLKADSIYNNSPNDIDVRYIIRNNIFLGLNYSGGYDTTKAMMYFVKAKKLCEESENVKLQADVIQNIGEVYFEINDYANAEKFIVHSIELAKQSNNLEIEAFAKLTLSKIYATQEDWGRSLQMVHSAEKIFRDLSEPRNLYITQLVRGEMYLRKGDSDAALRTILDAVALGDSTNHYFLHGVNYKYVADLYFDLNQLDQACKYYETSLQFSNSLDETEYEEVVLRLTKIYKSKGQNEKMSSLVNKLLAYQSTSRDEMQIELIESQKFEAEIHKAKSERAILEINNRTWIRLITILSLATIICLLFGLYAFNESRKNKALNQKVNKQNEELRNINSELKNFTSIASHDLKSPIRSISSFIGVLTPIKLDYFFCLLIMNKNSI